MALPTLGRRSCTPLPVAASLCLPAAYQSVYFASRVPREFDLRVARREQASLFASRSSVHVDAWRLLMRDLVRASFECDSLGILATSNRVGHVRRFPTILLIDSADGPFPRHGRDAPLRCPRWSDSAQLTVSGRLSISTHRFSSTALQIQGLHRAGLSFSLCRSAPATVICIPFQIMWLSETDANSNDDDDGDNE